jgi:hypothetical protein
MTASVTYGRALRYAEGSARGLIHHVLGHCRGMIPRPTPRRGAETKGLIDSAMYGRTWGTHWNPSDDGPESRRISE